MSSFQLNSNQIEQANTDGFVLLPNIRSLKDCQTYLERLTSYSRREIDIKGNMHIQTEPKVERGEINTEGDQIRKISGIAVHDPIFQDLVITTTIIEAMKQLMTPNLKLFRADALMKPPFVGSAKGMHQDSPYWPIKPMELWSCWMPFEAATLVNGCMQVIPKSHKKGPLKHIKTTDDYIVTEDQYDPSETLAVPMNPGDGLFFHSLLLHSTLENKSEKSRRAITMSYMASEYHYTGNSPKPNYLKICGIDVLGGV